MTKSTNDLTSAVQRRTAERAALKEALTPFILEGMIERATTAVLEALVLMGLNRLAEEVMQDAEARKKRRPMTRRRSRSR